MTGPEASAPKTKIEEWKEKALSSRQTALAFRKKAIAFQKKAQLAIDTNKELKATVRLYKKRGAVRQEEIAQLKATNSTLEVELGARAEATRRLRNDLVAEQQEKVLYRQAVEEFKEHALEVEARHQSDRDLLSTKSAELEELRHRLDVVMNELAIERDASQSLKQKLESSEEVTRTVRLDQQGLLEKLEAQKSEKEQLEWSLREQLAELGRSAEQEADKRESERQAAADKAEESHRLILGEFEEKNRSLAAHNQELSSKNEVMSSELSQLRESLSISRNSEESLRAQVERLSCKGEELERVIVELERTRLDIQSRLSENIQGLAQAKSDAQQAIQELGLAKASLERSKMESDELAARNRSLEQELSQRSELAQRDEERLESLGSKLTLKTEEVRKLQLELEDLQAKIREFTTEREVMLETANSLTSQLSERDASVEDLAAKVAELSEESARHKKGVAVAEDRADEFELENLELQEQLQTALEEQATAEEDLVSLQLKKEELQSKQSELIAEREQALEEVETLLSQFAVDQKRHEKLEGELESSMEENVALLDQLQLLEEALKENTVAIDLATADKNELLEAHRVEKADLTQRLAELKANSEEDLVALQLEKEELQHKQSELIAEREQALEKIETLSSQLADEQKRHEKIEDELESSLEENVDLLDQLQLLEEELKENTAAFDLELENKDGLLETHRVENADLTQQLAELKGKWNEHELSLREITSALEIAEVEVKRKQTTIEVLTRETQSLSVLVESNELTIRSQAEQARELEKREAEAQAKILALHDDETELLEENRRAYQELRDMAQELETLKDDLTRSQNSADAYEIKCHQLEVEIKKSGSDNSGDDAKPSTDDTQKLKLALRSLWELATAETA